VTICLAGSEIHADVRRAIALAITAPLLASLAPGWAGTEDVLTVVNRRGLACAGAAESSAVGTTFAASAARGRQVQ